MSRLKRLRDRVIGRRLTNVPVEVEKLNSAVADLSAEQAIASRERREIVQRLDSLAANLDHTRETVEREFERQLTINHVNLNREPEARQRLIEVRKSDEYKAPFEESNPLVSILIPTWRNYEALEKVALPSILAQEHENFEVLIVGDHAPDETAEVVASFNDPRLKFTDLNRRGPYPTARGPLWCVAGAPPLNQAQEVSTGLWIAPFADDDGMRKTHLSNLVAEAQEERYEVCYGQAETHFGDGTTKVYGSFPPKAGIFCCQGAIFHSELNFIEADLHAWMFDFGTDTNRLLKMLRIGVRFGMIDDVVVDYYPSRLHGRDDGIDEPINQESFDVHRRVFEPFENQG